MLIDISHYFKLSFIPKVLLGTGFVFIATLSSPTYKDKFQLTLEIAFTAALFFFAIAFVKQFYEETKRQKQIINHLSKELAQLLALNLPAHTPSNVITLQINQSLDKRHSHASQIQFLNDLITHQLSRKKFIYSYF